MTNDPCWVVVSDPNHWTFPIVREADAKAKTRELPFDPKNPVLFVRHPDGDDMGGVDI